MRFSKISAVIILLAGFYFFYSCHLLDRKDSATAVAINPDFEMHPPIASDVLVKKITGDDNNLLLVAKFSDSVLKDRFLAINFDTSKLVLRDDGEQADEKAGDGLFSIIVPASAKEFGQVAQRYSELSAGVKRFIFKGRSIIADTIPTRFDRHRFDDGGMISIKDLPTPPAPPALKDHSLMITDLHVVEDPAKTYNFCTQTGNIDGPWTFKTLMKNLAATSPGAVVTDVQLSDFVEHFFSSWTAPVTVNGETVSPRSEMIRSLQAWAAKSQILPLPRVPVGKLDMRAVPFKLTAIVNRLDLRGNSGYGFSNAGEARFVFCMMSTNGCTAASFNVIFEYGIPKKKCADVKAFAQQWYDLSSLAFTDPQYNTQLQAITDQFTICGTSPSKPDQSSINQVRSNELGLAVVPWELREFHLSNTSHLLEPATVAKTPADKYNEKLNNTDVQLLTSFINNNAAAIIAGNYSVPASFSGQDFLGAHAFTGRSAFPVLSPVGMPSGVEPFHWNGLNTAGAAFITNPDARQVFSLNTCGGCHGGETQTAFTMVNPVPFGTAAGLSGFLTGTAGISTGGVAPVDLDGNNGIMNVPDPAGRTSSNNLRKFNDLQRRADDLQSLVSSPCHSVFSIKEILMRKPLGFVH